LPSFWKWTEENVLFLHLLIQLWNGMIEPSPDNALSPTVSSVNLFLYKKEVNGPASAWASFKVFLIYLKIL